MSSLSQGSLRPVDSSPEAGPSRKSMSVDPSRKKELKGWRHSAAGSCVREILLIDSVGGIAGAIVTSPFDVVKVRWRKDDN
jgi:solute carrier family 25, member 33/36